MELIDIEQLLMEIGLTKQEARCYLSLYKLKESKTGDLSKESNIATANIYPVLNNLLKKGLISYRIQNNVKIFIANPPDSFNDFVESKQKQINEQKEKVKQTISQLKTQKNQIETQSNYKYYEGVSGIKSMWFDIINELKSIDKKNTLKIHSSKKGSTETMFAFYDEFHKERVKLGFSYKVFIDERLKEHGKKRSQLPKTEVKYLDMNTDTSWGVIGDLFFMYYLTGKVPVCFLIKDEKIARTYEEVFNRLWNIKKK